MSYRLKWKRKLRPQVERIVREQQAKAIADLDDANREVAVHQVRKRFKKLRALAKLLRPGLTNYKEVNAWHRDRGMELSAARDAEAMLETVELLQERFQDAADAAALAELAEALKSHRDRLTGDSSDLDARLLQLREALDSPEPPVEWRLDGKLRQAALEGMTANYRRGRKALREALRDPADDTLHELRKRAKNHWLHMELMRALWKPVLTTRAEEAKRLSDLLGDDHNLAVLQQQLCDPPAELDTLHAIEHVRDLIFQLREELQRQALPLAGRLFAEKPAAIRKRFQRYGAR